MYIASQLTLTLSDCTFTGNQASQAGGAVYWNFAEVIGYDNWTYTNNTADLYGNNYAWFAQNLIQISQQQYEASVNSRRSLSDDLTVNGTDSLSLDGLGSGSTIPDTYIALVDKFGQVVGIDSSSTTSLNINTTGVSSTYSPVLTGTVTKTATKGMFYFTNVIFTAGPNSSYSKFSLSLINQYRSLLFIIRNRQCKALEYRICGYKKWVWIYPESCC